MKFFKKLEVNKDLIRIHTEILDSDFDDYQYEEIFSTDTENMKVILYITGHCEIKKSFHYIFYNRLTERIDWKDREYDLCCGIVN